MQKVAGSNPAAPTIFSKIPEEPQNTHSFQSSPSLLSFLRYHKSFKSQKKAQIIQKTDNFKGFSPKEDFMLKAFNAIIHGRVQGVGFRYFAKRQADELKINGWVRNLPDGTVEITAKGPLEALEQFMQSLKTGPIGSRVDQVQAQWFEAPRDSKGFEIIG